eukprot:c13294_g1_i1.p1 GENE.c13294_g1_i1~~c13294_g1_i1.p1  ORF type:complete len:185 (-),score=56.61 c13294_g1_i1:41-595(-)
MTGWTDSEGYVDCALAVVMKKDRTIHLPALAEVFSKVFAHASQVMGSVHVPRIGANDPKMNWYAVEKLLRREVSQHKVNAFVYTFVKKRRFQSTTAFASQVPQQQQQQQQRQAHSPQYLSATNTKRFFAADPTASSSPTPSPSASPALASPPSSPPRVRRRLGFESPLTESQPIVIDIEGEDDE